MSPTTLPDARKRHGLQGRQVLGMFLAFFGVVFVVNGAMIYKALSTHTGVVSSEPYRKGLHYNDRIAAGERQASLHWSDTLVLGRDGRVALALADGEGRPVTGLKVVVLGRPSTNRLDFKLDLREAAPGHYEAQGAPLAEGSWLLALEARTDTRAEDPIYRVRRRLWLKP
jgi:nitrogen fixation protein FixH